MSMTITMPVEHGLFAWLIDHLQHPMEERRRAIAAALRTSAAGPSDQAAISSENGPGMLSPFIDM